MITAIRTAHAGKGPWATGGGWEYPLLVTGVMVALAEAGPGRPSVDHRAFPRLRGTGWALAGLAAAGTGSALATSERFNASPPEEPRFEHPRRFVREPAREEAVR